MPFIEPQRTVFRGAATYGAAPAAGQCGVVPGVEGGYRTADTLYPCAACRTFGVRLETDGTQCPSVIFQRAGLRCLDAGRLAVVAVDAYRTAGLKAEVVEQHGVLAALRNDEGPCTLVVEGTAVAAIDEEFLAALAADEGVALHLPRLHGPRREGIGMREHVTVRFPGLALLAERTEGLCLHGGHARHGAEYKK